MRTDITVDVDPDHRTHCPQIPDRMPGRPASVARGDYIQTYTHRGRVVGTIRSPIDGLVYLVTIVQGLSGSLSERWIHPNDVIDTAYGHNDYAEKALWFHGEAFLATSHEDARDIFNRIVFVHVNGPITLSTRQLQRELRAAKEKDDAPSSTA